MGLRKIKKVIQLNRHPIDNTLQEVRLQKRNRFVRRRTLMILTISLLVIGFATLPLIKNYQESNKLKIVHAQAVDELTEAQEQQEELDYRIQLLEDEEYIAKLARKELNLSKENEILINLPEKEETKTTEKDKEEESIKENK